MARSRREPQPLGPGRESDVLALLSPYALGREVAAGFRLMNVRIEPAVIEVELKGPAGQAKLRLRPSTPATRTTESFVIERDAGARAGVGRVAADALIAAIRRNDRGGFWRSAAPLVGRTPARERGFGISWPLGVTVGFGTLALLVAWRGRRRPGA